MGGLSNQFMVASGEWGATRLIWPQFADRGTRGYQFGAKAVWGATRLRFCILRYIITVSCQERGTSCTRFAPKFLLSKPKINSSGLLPDITKSCQLLSYSPRPPHRRLVRRHLIRKILINYLLGFVLLVSRPPCRPTVPAFAPTAQVQ